MKKNKSKNKKKQPPSIYEDQQYQFVLSQILQSKLTIQLLFDKTQQFSALRTQPILIQKIFEEHLEIVIEMVNWTFIPKHQAKTMNGKMRTEQYTYKSKEFMKNNWCFYEYLFLALYFKKLSLDVFFHFLEPEYHFEPTIPTALGYFSEIMVPFARYQFHDSSLVNDKIEGQVNEQEKYIGILELMSQQFINQIIKHSHFWPIYQFLTNAVLVGLVNPKDTQPSQKVVQQIFQYCQYPDILKNFQKGVLSEPKELVNETSKFGDLLENISITLRQLMSNLQIKKENPSVRAMLIMGSVLRSRLMTYCVEQLKKSRYCCRPQKKSWIRDSILSQISKISKIGTSNVSSRLFFSQEVKPSYKNGETQFLTDELVDEDIAQTLIKIIQIVFEIYTKIPKKYIKSSKLKESSLNRQSEYYVKVLNKYRQQIQRVLDEIPILNNIIDNSYINPEQQPFSIGEPIKPISFMKYQYFSLLYHCLVMVQEKDISPQSIQKQSESIISNSRQSETQQTQQSKISQKLCQSNQIFKLDVQSLNLIQIIERYLSENRWNNITHHLLQKIFDVLIVSRYECIKNNIERDGNRSLENSFLEYIIKSFKIKDYQYPDTNRRTSYGNLNSLCNIAKKLANNFNKTNEFLVILGQLEPWKRFLIIDLRQYEERAFPQIPSPSKKDLMLMNQKSEQNYEQIKVDEFDSIRDLIENVFIEPRWPKRERLASQSGIYQSLKESGFKIPERMYYSHTSTKKEKSKESVIGKLRQLKESLFSKKQTETEYQKDSIICEPNQKMPTTSSELKNKSNHATSDNPKKLPTSDIIKPPRQ